MSAFLLLVIIAIMPNAFNAFAFLRVARPAQVMSFGILKGLIHLMSFFMCVWHGYN